MSEIVVSGSEEAAEGESPSRSKRQRTERQSGSTAVLKWERFLPKMVLRVLLVEADDSTRQIIAALLRKCRYKVSAVPDGLKAWETLKEKPHSVDIILTEVELPSISGFALLTLVMEHDVCKNIPVIMMSSHDSISMVLKCMLKGAADFLIKPVRKNELRNLWQHIWRRHTLTGGCTPQNLSVTEQKGEAGSENNTACNLSSDYAVYSQQDKDGSEKESDAQGLFQPKCKSTKGNYDTEKPEGCAKLPKESVIPGTETEKSSKFRTKVAAFNEADNSIALKLEKDCRGAEGTTHHVCAASESAGNGNIKSEINYLSNEEEPLCRVIDLIGTFDNHSMCSHEHSTSINTGSNFFECIPQLELSLKRFCPSSLKDEEAGERCALKHSNASAFSRYNTTKTLQSLGNCMELEEGTNKICDLLHNHCSENTVGTLPQQSSTLDNNQGNVTTLLNCRSGEAELAFPRPRRLGPVPTMPVPESRYDEICGGAGYGHVLLPLFYAQSEMPMSASSPGPDCQQEWPLSVETNSEMNKLKQGYHGSEETMDICDNQSVNEEKKWGGMEKLRHESSAAGHSCSSSLCNGVAAATEISSSLHGIEKSSAPEREDGLIGTGWHGSSEREAALTKFRQKRKDRCYEKKVRYESRKRLAEQRPRVKGQFVRHQTII